MTKPTTAPTSSVQSTVVQCPICDMRAGDLEQLDLHLRFACTSRSPPTPDERTRKTQKMVEYDRDSDPFVEIIEDQSANPKSTSQVTHPTRPAKMVLCPACSKGVTKDNLNFHLDLGCISRISDRTESITQKPEFSDNIRKPPGLIVIEDFISEAEEADLVRYLESAKDWKPSTRNGRCEMMHWGHMIDYSGAKPKTRLPDKQAGEQDLPEFLKFIVERFTKYSALSAWSPNNLNASRYVKEKNHFLAPHFDDRKLSGEIICNVSLLCDCVMTFRKPGTTVTPFRVLLPRRSAAVMSRSSRYDFTHEIAHEDFHGPKRLSLNFRQQVLPLHSKPLRDTPPTE